MGYTVGKIRRKVVAMNVDLDMAKSRVARFSKLIDKLEALREAGIWWLGTEEEQSEQVATLVMLEAGGVTGKPVDLDGQRAILIDSLQHDKADEIEEDSLLPEE